MLLSLVRYPWIDTHVHSHALTCTHMCVLVHPCTHLWTHVHAHAHTCSLWSALMHGFRSYIVFHGSLKKSLTLLKNNIIERSEHRSPHLDMFSQSEICPHNQSQIKKQDSPSPRNPLPRRALIPEVATFLALIPGVSLSISLFFVSEITQ